MACSSLAELRARAWCVLALLLASCAHPSQKQYGIERLSIEGMKRMDERALESCLATRERDEVRLGFGSIRKVECDQPPFDNARAGVRPFAWPWTPWPAYDEAVFKLDLERIQRWYEARGFYDARVLHTELDPKSAAKSDRIDCRDPPCTLAIRVDVEEGEPVRIRKVALHVDGTLPWAVKARLSNAVALEEGDRFDEALYTQAKTAVLKELREAGYARAKVEGDVALNRGLLWADVTLRVTPGALCKIGKVRIQSSAPVPTGPVLAAAKLRHGQRQHRRRLRSRRL